MAGISNPDSLISVGQNNFELGADTSAPAVGGPGTGTRGSVQGGALESSNVDIATEFSKLIVAQEAYSANTKLVTSADQMLQQTVNMKQ